MEDRKFLIGVIVGGLIGGLGSWVWATTVGPPPLIDSIYFAIPSYVFLGGLAGYLGVVLIAKTDTKEHFHASAFALACGLFWGPVITGAKAIVTQKEAQETARNTKQIGAQLGNEVSLLRNKIEADLASIDDHGTVEHSIPWGLAPSGDERTIEIGSEASLQQQLERIEELERELMAMSDVR